MSQLIEQFKNGFNKKWYLHHKQEDGSFVTVGEDVISDIITYTEALKQELIKEMGDEMEVSKLIEFPYEYLEQRKIGYNLMHQKALGVINQVLS